MNSKKILVVGDSIVDEYVSVSTTRMCPENDALPVYDVDKIDSRLGGAANVVMNVASLSDGEDRISYCGFTNKFVCDSLKKHFIDVSKCCMVTDDAMLHKIRYFDSLQKMLFRCDDMKKFSYECSKSLLSWIHNRMCDNDKDNDVIIFSDYDKGTITEDLFSYIMCSMRAQNTIVVIDSKRKDLTMYKDVDVLKLNEREWAAQEEVQRDLIDMCKLGVIVTTGAKGACIYQKELGSSYIAVSAVKSDVVDVTGCGDTHTAALALALAKGEHILASTKYANEAAAIAVKRFGTYNVKRIEI